MKILTSVLVALIALLHCYFMILEMFFWQKPLGLKTFGLKLEFANASKSLAANQGLYNGFLAAGLFWGLSLGTNGISIRVFFLACIFVAGVFGSLTVHRKILYIQALPALFTLIMTLMVAADI